MTAAAGPVLRDIHLPPEPSWWPPAPGWWLLMLLALVLLVWVGSRIARRLRAQRRRRALQRELDALLATHAGADAAAARVAALSVLLRRATRRYAPQALMLRDEAWLAFLDGDDAGQPFRTGAGRLLLDGPYRERVPSAEADALVPLVRRRLDRFVAVTDA